MASREDAEAGWEIFKDSDFSLSLGEVNNELAKRNYAPVSTRMYAHYRKLVRYGYENYVPINQLDVKTLQDPVWDRAIRGRYLLMPVAQPVALRLLVDGEVLQFSGDVTHLSEGQVVVRLDDQPAVQFFKGLTKTEPFAEIVFPDDGEILLGQIERITLDNDNVVATVRLTLLEPAPTQRLTNRPLVEGAALDVDLPQLGDRPALSAVVQIFFWLLQGLEATRVGCQELLVELDPDDTLDLPPPRIVRVSMSSPLHAVLDVAWPYGVMFVAMWRAYVKNSKEYWDKEISKETAIRLRWENEQRGIARRFQPKVVIESMVGSLKKALAEKGQKEPAVETPSDIERVATLLEKQVLPAIRELDRATRGQLELTTPKHDTPEIAAIAPPETLALPKGSAAPKKAVKAKKAVKTQGKKRKS